MLESPTLILLAESVCESLDARRIQPHLSPDAHAGEWLTPIQATIHKALHSGLQIRLVAPSALHQQVRALIPAEHILSPDTLTPYESKGGQLARSIAQAVHSSAQAQGWLLLTCDMPLLQSSTLQALCSALQRHPVVYPEYRSRRGHPVGFSSEFYSTLVRLHNDRDLQRLMTQYPAQGVPVDDAGVLMAQPSGPHLTQLRTLLQGHLACDAPL